MKFYFLFATTLLLAVGTSTAYAQEAASPAPSVKEGAEDSALESPNQPTTETAPEEANLLRDFNDKALKYLFFDIAFGAIEIGEVDKNNVAVLDDYGNPKTRTVGLPFLVVCLFFGSLFFTFWFRWINIRGIKHSIDVIRGKYDKPEDEGEISHFRALTSALSATVGLGNIAGVAVAIQTGGPGAVFWMITTAVFSMSAKFSSCTLAQMYRKVNADGSISGGPMYYLDIGLKEKGSAWGFFGKILALSYAVMIMVSAIGAGNMFQANQTTQQIISSFSLQPESSLTIGIVLAIAVAVVILGGIKRIGSATSKIVPLMCFIYTIASLFVIFSNFSQLPEAIGKIITLAFSKNAFFGGMFGVLVTGVTRAAFSNEGGLGSAAIAHAAAKTDEPVREGIVAMIGPVIDTMIICLMTGLVVVITGAWENPESLAKGAELNSTLRGVLLTSDAFATVIPWFPYVLTVCVTLFAYSTLISWCYYGERGWIYFFDHFNCGLKTVILYRISFVLFIVYGAVNTLDDVMTFSDVMILSMAFPNILGSIILAPKISAKLNDYWDRYQRGSLAVVND